MIPKVLVSLRGWCASSPIEVPSEPPHPQDARVGSSCATDAKTEFGDREVERSSSGPSRHQYQLEAPRGQRLEPFPGGIHTGEHNDEPGRLLPEHPSAEPQRRSSR